MHGFPPERGTKYDPPPSAPLFVQRECLEVHDLTLLRLSSASGSASASSNLYGVCGQHILQVRVFVVEERTRAAKLEDMRSVSKTAALTRSKGRLLPERLPA